MNSRRIRFGHENIAVWKDVYPSRMIQISRKCVDRKTADGLWAIVRAKTMSGRNIDGRYE